MLTALAKEAAVAFRSAKSRVTKANQAMKPPVIVIFIDDLDRCKPDSIVSVLEAINVVLGGSEFFVVAGVERERIQDAVANQYGKALLKPLPPTFADEYLRKIFQVMNHFGH